VGARVVGRRRAAVRPSWLRAGRRLPLPWVAARRRLALPLVAARRRVVPRVGAGVRARVGLLLPGVGRGRRRVRVRRRLAVPRRARLRRTAPITAGSLPVRLATLGLLQATVSL